MGHLTDWMERGRIRCADCAVTSITSGAGRVVGGVEGQRDTLELYCAGDQGYVGWEVAHALEAAVMVRGERASCWEYSAGWWAGV